VEVAKALGGSFKFVKDDGGGGDGAITGAKLQSNHHQQTNTIFTGRMPFLSPNQQRQSAEGIMSLQLA